MQVPLELIVEVAKAHSIEPGWLWLYLNGFKRRVPREECSRIELEVLRIDGVDLYGLLNALALVEEGGDAGTE